MRKAEDLEEVRAYVNSLMKEEGYPDDHQRPSLISKIESTEAMDNF